MNAGEVQHGAAIEARFQRLDDTPGAKVSVTLKLVAVRDSIGQWTAYFGHPDATDEEVADHGFKMEAQQARAIFGNITGRWRD